jgi:hypothetical protein
MLEKTVESKLRKAVEDIGGKAYKFESPGNNGVPDRIVILPKGRIYFIELKKPKNSKTAALQKLQHQRLKNLGANVRTIYTIEQIEAFIQEVGT